MKTHLLAAALALGAAHTSALADVLVSLNGGILTTSDGTTPVADGGLVLLVASTTDSVFSGPTTSSSLTVGSVFNGDDIVLAALSVDSVSTAISGAYKQDINITYGTTFPAAVSSGDQIKLYWFPTLTKTSTAIAGGTSYGEYRTDATMSGSSTGWLLPADGQTVIINLLTLSAGGDIANNLGSASLTVAGPVIAPAITTQPASQTVTAGSPASFTVAATGSNLSYQWKKGGADIPGATTATYSIAATSATDAGSYTVTISNSAGTITSNAATLTVNAVVVAPAITTQPASQTVIAGAAASFTVAASGTSPSYQWKKGGTNIPGATTATYSIASAAASDAGSYTVTVSNSAGTIDSAAATLTVVAAPTITTQPASQSVALGSSALFVVSATGTNLSYQWRKDGANISGATDATYSIPTAATTHAGAYSVVVSNTVNGVANSVTSASATLTIIVPPAITTQPSATQTVVAGASASFTVAASGENLTYQWKKDGANISGANSATYTIGSTSASSAGSYTVVVTNAAGNATSTTATLHVIPAFAAPVPTGYAASATGGGTTNHALVTTAADFKTHAESSSAVVITVSGTLSLPAKVSVKSNKTIQGLDASATIAGNLELASGVSNVIIRGLNITNPAGDGITLSGATNVFITHVTFFDCSDTLLRIVGGADNVTVSWCEFYYTAGQTAHRYATLVGAASGETKALRVTLNHNWWSDRVDQQMPDSTWGHLHLFNNYFNPGATPNTQGSIARANAQFLSERNQYTNVASPLTKTGGGLIRAIGNAYTDTTGTAPDAGTDTVFTPGYSYRLFDVGSLAATLASDSGNTAGAASTNPAPGTASITASGTAITTGGAFTLTASTQLDAVTGWQWRLNNVDIPNATATSYSVSSAQAANAGVYTVVLSRAAGEAIVSSPVTISVNNPPPAPPAGGGGGGGGSPSVWFLLALGTLAGLRRLTQKR